MTAAIAATEERIRAQRLIVDSHQPGTAEHRLATKVLLLLLDSLHFLGEIEKLRTEAEDLSGRAAE